MGIFEWEFLEFEFLSPKHRLSANIYCDNGVWFVHLVLLLECLRMPWFQSPIGADDGPTLGDRFFGVKENIKEFSRPF